MLVRYRTRLTAVVVLRVRTSNARPYAHYSGAAGRNGTQAVPYSMEGNPTNSNLHLLRKADKHNSIV